MTDPAFEGFLKADFRWPRAGDRSFTKSERRLDNAYIAPHVRDRLVMMVTGYKLAADVMVERSAKDRFDRDALVYPIIFNYRQFIELSLKYLIATYGHTVGVKANWDSHDLAELWREFNKVLNGYGTDDPDGTDSIVEAMVAEFAKVDPRSFSYRYPVDKKGEPIPVEQEELDLAALADAMQALDGYFNGCDGYLDHLQSAGS